MSQERMKEIRERLVAVERILRPLEWDNVRNQINDYRKQQLAKLKVEQAALQAELEGFERL